MTVIRLRVLPCHGYSWVHDNSTPAEARGLLGALLGFPDGTDITTGQLYMLGGLDQFDAAVERLVLDGHLYRETGIPERPVWYVTAHPVTVAGEVPFARAQQARNLLRAAQQGLTDRNAYRAADLLIAEVGHALQRGWPSWRISGLLTLDVPDNEDVGYSWLWQLRAALHGTPPAAAEPAPAAADRKPKPEYPPLGPGDRADVPYCGRCRDPQTRVYFPDLDDGTVGRPRPCPRCHPDRDRHTEPVLEGSTT